MPSKVGGVQTYIEGLAEGFKTIDNLRIERFWLVDKNGSDWISRIVPEKDNIIICKTRHRHELANQVTPRRFFDLNKRKQMKLMDLDERLPMEPVEVSELKPHLIHFCSQDAFLTSAPSLYHPHDLQHKIFPQNFASGDIEWRESAWRSYADFSKYVVVGAPHVKADLIRFWGIRRSKIKVIELAPLGISRESGHEIIWEKPVGEITLVYPSAYYEHKNHINLFKAILILSKDFPNLKLRLFGGVVDDNSQVTKMISDLGIREFVVQHGWVSRQQLDSVLSQSDLVVVPSTYESASFPIIEAQNHKVPFICSDIPSLRLQLQGRGIFFDPHKPEDISAKAKMVLRERVSISEKLVDLRNWSQVVDDYYQLYKWI
jgi:glycosyltransferase involved in cell wall biosynthesis